MYFDFTTACTPEYLGTHWVLKCYTAISYYSSHPAAQLFWFYQCMCFRVPKHFSMHMLTKKWKSDKAQQDGWVSDNMYKYKSS